MRQLTPEAAFYIDPQRLVCALLTGMGNDGAEAMTELRARGGKTIAEAEETLPFGFAMFS